MVGLLKVDKKKRFLVTMVVIMACATAINYGLYNVLSTYFHNNEDSSTNIQLNIIIVLVVLASATVIMVVLIPKENVKELMAKIEQNDTVLTGGGGTTGGNLGAPLGTGEHYEKTDEEKLRDMIDEDLGDNDNKK